MKRFELAVGVVVVAGLTGCQDVIDLDPLDERAPIEADVRPPPISGGTLTLMADGTAVVSDPDRDLVYVAEVAQRRLRHTIALQPGDEPGRVVEGDAGRVHVVLRGGGGIATIDTEDGTLLARHAVCSDPRGLAHDGIAGTLHVACADGSLVELLEETGEELGRELREPDLRDVLIVDGEVRVSTFRAASLAYEDGGDWTPETFPHQEARVAWRTRTDLEGNVWMLHQLVSTQPIPTEPPPDDGNDDGGLDGGGGGVPYGGSGFFCQPGISHVAVSLVQGEESSFTIPIPVAPLTVDMAISPGGEWVALAMPGADETEQPVGAFILGDGCFMEEVAGMTGQVTAVAFDPSGTFVAQSREPAELLVQSSFPFGAIDRIALSDAPRYDTGHEIFHRTTESNLSCATCHPEGTDDGHVWLFEGLGPRRTQPLDVGLADMAPFHWDGDMDDLDVLMSEVLAHRMGGKRQSEPRRESFASWLFAQHRPPADTGRDEAALVADGEALFVSLECASCHTGEGFGGALTTPIRGMELQVPSLRRVSLRPPFMHDGRSATLDHAVVDMIESTTEVAASEHTVAALSAYLRTL